LFEDFDREEISVISGARRRIKELSFCGSNCSSYLSHRKKNTKTKKSLDFVLFDFVQVKYQALLFLRPWVIAL